MLALAAMAVLASTALAEIRPLDQRSAERLTVHRGDLGPGWKVDKRASTVPRLNSCASAPINVQLAITGFIDSAVFQTVDTRGGATSTTRVFASDAFSKDWFRWAAGASSTACVGAVQVGPWKQAGYQPRLIGRSRESFPVDPKCHVAARCFNQLAAWRIRFMVSKGGSRYEVDYDHVVVRTGATVVVFLFSETGGPLTNAESIVAAVLASTTTTDLD